MSEEITIDDLFERFDHHKPRERTFQVTSPVVMDITKDVLDEMENFSAMAEIPQGTTYFGFFHPHMPDVTYYKASARSGFQKMRAEQAESYQRFEALKSPFDKVAQRRLCEKIGIFKNPRYLDVRKFFADLNAELMFNIQPHEFLAFPTDEIVANLGQLPRSYIFANMVDGFRIRNSKNGSFTIAGKNEAVKKANEATKKIKDPAERIDTFLDKLVENGFSFRAVGRDNAARQRQDPEELVDAILAHPNNLYIKDARTGGGYLVVRVRKQDGEAVVESDSPQYERLLDYRHKKYEEIEHRYERLLELQAPENVISNERRLLDAYAPLDPRSILLQILENLGNPIIEEEVPYETFGDNRVEFRYICQKLHSSEDFDVVGYAKVSQNGVAANISLGGSGAAAEDMLMEMYRQRMPGQDVRDIYSTTMRTYDRLQSAIGEFAEQVYKHYEQDGSLAEIGEEPPRDFAVDIVPSWNKDKEDFEFYFLEINHQYGYRGLWVVDPELAEVVAMNKSYIKESKGERI